MVYLMFNWLAKTLHFNSNLECWDKNISSQAENIIQHVRVILQSSSQKAVGEWSVTNYVCEINVNTLCAVTVQNQKMTLSRAHTSTEGHQPLLVPYMNPF